MVTTETLTKSATSTPRAGSVSRMLKGEAAIVTGSTSGIGLGIASALAAQGARVMLNGFGDSAAIEEIRKGLADRYDVKTAYSPADMSKPPDIRGLIADAERVFGFVSILVNNAGIQHVAPVEDFPDDKWDAIMAINLSAAFHASKATLPGMKRRQWGRIINIASAHGLVGSTEKGAYVVAKHGLVGLTKVIAIECANSGVTCNAICPGWVLTPLVQKQIEAKAKEDGISVEQAKEHLLREKQPMLKFTTPEEIGGLAVFLCSEDAATMTGGTVQIDGGWTAQ
jgi:3-hydroxybutyrate dehydrogenase